MSITVLSDSYLTRSSKRIQVSDRITRGEEKIKGVIAKTTDVCINMIKLKLNTFRQFKMFDFSKITLFSFNQNFFFFSFPKTSGIILL